MAIEDDEILGCSKRCEGFGFVDHACVGLGRVWSKYGLEKGIKGWEVRLVGGGGGNSRSSSK